MKKHITLAALLALGISANAGTSYYWVGGTAGNEFGFINGTATQWRNGNDNTYVLPASADSIDALKTIVESDSFPKSTTTETTPAGGIDFVLGGDDATISVNSYYYVSSLTTSSWSSGKNYTFNFGETGAIYSRYQTTLEAFQKITLDVALTGSGERVLFGTASSLMEDSITYDWSTLSLSNQASVSLSADGYTVLEGVFTDRNSVTLKAGEAALLYANNNISVLYMAIPEPSAFGLLAGLGALALVGARRRRR